MRRFSSFLMGMVFGAGMLYLLMIYHIVHAADGHHLIPKIDSQLPDTYVDIREFTFKDWADHSDLAAALIKADRGDLVEGAASGALQRGIDNLLGGRESQVQ